MSTERNNLQSISADLANKTQDLKDRINSHSVRNLKPEVLIAVPIIFVSVFLYMFGVANLFLPINFLINNVFRLLELVLRLVYYFSVLLIPLSGLFVTALFTCPSNDSFVPSMKSYISFFNNNNKNETLYDSISNYAATKYAEYTLFADPNFLNLGFCTIVKCKVNDRNLWSVGIFKVWIPLSG